VVRQKTSNATIPARNMYPGAEKVSCHSRGRKKSVNLSFACSVQHVARRPAMAPLAPSDVMVSLPIRTWEVRETIDPKIPEQK